MILPAGPALMACAAMLPPGSKSLDFFEEATDNALNCVPSTAAGKAALLGWRQQVGQLLAAGLAVPPSVPELLDQAEFALLEQRLDPTDESALAELELALGQLQCANLRCPNVAGCSEAEQQGKRCARCGMVRYCSAACQRADWKRHKRACKPA